MKARTFSHGQVRVEFSPKLQVKEVDQRTRSLDSAFADQLAQNEFQLVASFDVLPNRSLPHDSNAAWPPIRIRITEPHQRAPLVLVRCDGDWSPHLPTGEHGVAEFEVTFDSNSVGVPHAESMSVLIFISDKATEAPQDRPPDRPSSEGRAPERDRPTTGKMPQIHMFPRFDLPRIGGAEIAEQLTRAIDLPPAGRGLDRGLDIPRAAPPAAMVRGGGGPEAAMEEDVEPPPEEQVEAHVRAEMPSKITVGVPMTVRVRLSRNEITAATDTITQDEVVGVGEHETLSVRIVPKRNLTITGSDSDKFALPVGSGSSDVEFAVSPLAAGPVEVTVLVRRADNQVAANMTLCGDARDPDDPDRRRKVLHAQVVAAAGTSVVIDDAVWLEITQLDRPGYVTFQYEVRLPGGAPSLRYESGQLHDHEQFVADLFADIESAWTSFGDAPSDFRSFLQSRGSELFKLLFPEDMQTKLWELRNQLNTVFLMADEPYFPWELVHLKSPNGTLGQRPRFLAQYGLVRWQFLPFPKEPQLRARPGKVLSLCARNVELRYLLVDSLDEVEWLSKVLGAADTSATYAAVRKLLRRGGFDVLHFSGHGMAETADVAAAKIMLDDRTRNGIPIRQFLSATDVSSIASLAGTDGSGPLVVLNACQAGLGGEQLSSLGGFARAFLKAGAQAFVACLWSVKQQPSRIFVEKLYEQLIAEVPLGQAVSTARAEAQSREDPATWLAYAVYGRPDATLTLQ